VATKVVLVDHYDSYTFNLAHLIASVTGELPTIVQHDAIDPRVICDGPYTHVVLSPGPGNPERTEDFDAGRQLIVAAERPVLGVCLGMQGLVSTLGGVVAAAVPAHGEVSAIRHTGTGLFDGLPQQLRVVRYHSLAVTSLPAELVATAWSDNGTVMAVAHRSRPLAGVQFHPESVLTEHGRELMVNFLRWS